MTDLSLVFLSIGVFLAVIVFVMIYFTIRVRSQAKKNEELTKWINKRYEKKGENQ